MLILTKGGAMAIQVGAVSGTSRGLDVNEVNTNFVENNEESSQYNHAEFQEKYVVQEGANSVFANPGAAAAVLIVKLQEENVKATNRKLDQDEARLNRIKERNENTERNVQAIKERLDELARQRAEKEE